MTELSANLVRPQTEDWKSVLAILPSVGVPPTVPGLEESKRQADKLEKIIYAIWADSMLDVQMIAGSHYMTLMGSQVVYSCPVPSEDRIRIKIKAPYRCCAKYKLDSLDLHHLAWDTDEDTEMILDMYPSLADKIAEKKGGRIISMPETVTYTEWNDENYRFFLVNDKWVEELPTVQHNWGFVPGAIIPNVIGTGSIWGRSDAQQVVHLSQVLSEVISMEVDGLFERIYDDVFIFDDNPIRQIANGPREWTQLSKDAHVQLLRAGMASNDISNMKGTLERLIRLIGGWPEVMSSEIDSAIPTGKAITALQGPVAARAAVKHIVTARGLERVNAFTLQLYEKMFGNETINLVALRNGVRTSIFGAAGRVGSEHIEFVPKRDINGKYDNILTFSPTGSDDYRRSIKLLQYREAGIISKDTIRQLEPGLDPEAEEAKIEREAMQDADRAGRAQFAAQLAIIKAQAQVQAEAAMQQQQQQQAVGQPALQQVGQVVPMAAGQAPAAIVSGPQGIPGQGRVPSAQNPQPSAQARMARANPNRITIQQLREQLSRVKGIKGRVFAGGQIAKMGWTESQVEIWLSNMQDKGPIFQQTDIGARNKFLVHKLTEGGLPNDGVIEVTPVKEVA
jgi:hypothetical protein